MLARRACLVLLLATWLHSVDAVITSAKQISYNQYAFKWVGVVPTLLDSQGEQIAASYSWQTGVGGILTIDSYSQYGNVDRAGQLNTDSSGRITFDTFKFETWRALVQKHRNDGSNRYQVEGDLSASSPYQLYMPKLSVTLPARRQLGHPGFGSGDDASGDASSGEEEEPQPAMLHIMSSRVAPILTYASINGVIVSADNPETYACTGQGSSAPGASYVCGYSVSVPLPSFFDPTIHTVQACALISETESACNETPNFPPSPPSPPSPPPSPPEPPPPPWPEVAPLTRMDVAGWVATGVLIAFFVGLGFAVEFKQRQQKRGTAAAYSSAA